MVMNNMPTDNAFTGIEAGTLKVTDDWFIKTLKQYQQLTPYFEPNSTGTASEPLQQLFASRRPPCSPPGPSTSARCASWARPSPST